MIPYSKRVKMSFTFNTKERKWKMKNKAMENVKIVFGIMTLAGVT
jgi:hypothetical protein